MHRRGEEEAQALKGGAANVTGSKESRRVKKMKSNSEKFTTPRSKEREQSERNLRVGEQPSRVAEVAQEREVSSAG